MLDQPPISDEHFAVGSLFAQRGLVVGFLFVFRLNALGEHFGL